MKRCRACGKRKSLRAFYRHGEGRPHKQRQSYCRTCCTARQHAAIERSKRWIREYARRWRRKNRTVLGQAKAALDELPRGLTTYYRLRHAAIMAYGGYRCACCGIGDPRFLTIDHVNNDGKRQRQKLGQYTSHKFHRWLRQRGYPRGFQVLCWNCNCGRHRNGGLCPHKDQDLAAAPLPDLGLSRDRSPPRHARERRRRS
ncbi:MAG: hypothetical protein JO128_23195 [Alphaproteobacteria bacterium]|nr:hypothetical protein [Alphaproteobacteria bacterium]